MVLPVPDGPGEIEGERQPGRVSLAQPPAIENQVVIRDLRERLVERPPRGGRQDDVVKASGGGRSIRPIG